MTTPTFLSLGVAEPIQRALAPENYLEPTPIQARAIPLILSGRDVVGIAQTGTGKTAAFGLPLLQRLAADRTKAGPHAVRALILAPTRELALPIHDSLGRYGRHLGLRLAADRTKAGPHAVRALILAPTRELALQIHDSLGRYGRHRGLRLAVVLGG